MNETEMQRKYIAHFISRDETLTEDDAREYLSYLTANPNAAFSERRITQLERYIRGIEREREADNAREEAWMAKAREIVSTKERWEALGAAWEELHDCGVGVTTWKYADNVIMRRWSYVTLDEELALVREGDAVLTKLIESEVQR